MFASPIDSKLKQARSVLIAGAGGGYDIVCGVPIAMALWSQGIAVHFASFSSTPLQDVEQGMWLRSTLLEVTAASSRPSYFPEGWLCRWVRDHVGRHTTVWCFEASGVGPLHENYRYLVETLDIDAVVVVDGGVDSLLRGDEYTLASPLEDALTIAAVSLLDVPLKALVSTAFGAERLDRISHAQVLARIADLTRAGAFWGAEAITPGAPEGDALASAIRYILDNQSGMRQSIVCGSLLAALEGKFGDQPVGASSRNTPPWISPLILLYWWFDLSEVARQHLYLPRLIPTNTFPEAAERLGEYMRTRPKRGWEEIPL
jgi:hypothetical protein